MTEPDVEPTIARVRMDHAKAADALAPFVFGYHLYTAEVADGAVHEDIGYPSWGSIRFQTTGAPYALRIGNRFYNPVPRAALFGSTSRALFTSSGSGTVIGLGLTPLGWARLLGGTADRHADRIAPLDTVLGEAASRFAAKLDGIEDIATAAPLFDEFLMERMLVPHRLDSMIGQLQAILVEPGRYSVAELAEELDIEPRRLARLSVAYFGFTPKLLLRRARFMRTMLRLMEDHGRPHIDMIDRDYHDQSHFVRDCKFFLSVSPRRFLKMKRPLDIERMIRRQMILGTAAQPLALPDGERLHA